MVLGGWSEGGEVRGVFEDLGLGGRELGVVLRKCVLKCFFLLLI